jgi:hypothetical protein
VQKANEELTTAAKYSGKARGKICIFALILIVIAAVLSIVLYFSLR